MSKKEIKAYCKRRAKAIETAAGNLYNKRDIPTSLQDMLTDIMHALHQRDINFYDVAESARQHFDAEVIGGEHG